MTGAGGAGPPTGTPTTIRRMAGVALATFLVHSVIALAIPLPSYFRKYALAAEHYLGGELPAERLMDFSPLYFRLSVTAERWLPNPEAALHWLQVALVAAAAGLLFGLLRRRFKTALSAAAVAVFALDRHVLVYERILEPEVLLLVSLLAFLFFLDHRGGRPWLAGAFAALGLAIRPTFLPVFLLTPLYFRLRQPVVGSGEGGRRWWRQSAAFALPVGLMLVLLALRAGSITGDPRTPVMNPGTVFFEGNNPLSQGTSAIYPPVVLELVRHGGEIPDSAHHFYRAVARADAGRELTISEVNAYWAGRASAFLRAEPGRFAKLLRDKLTRVFHAFRWHDIPTAWHYDQRLRLPTVTFALISTLALFGALAEVRRWRRSILFYAAGAAQLAVMLAFYVSARQRLVLVPVAIYFAAAALEKMFVMRRRALPLSAAAGLMTLVLMLPDDPMRDEVYRRRGHLETDRLLHEIREKSRTQPLARHADLAVAAMAAAPWWLDWLRPAYFPQDEGTLEERLADALAARPEGLFAVSADFDRATVLIEAGRLAEAERLLGPLATSGAAVYRGGRQPSRPLLLLGRIHALRGDRERGRTAMEEALERAPGDPFVLAELAALTGESRYRDLLDAYWSRLDGRYLLGRALLRYGRAREALAALTFVAERLPEFREPRIWRAAALGELGRLEEGAREYLEASRIRLEPVLAARQIAELFRRWARANPERSEVRFYAAQVLDQLGHFREALALLDAGELPPGLAAAGEEERRRIHEALGESAATVP